jgi:hypothetical protein
MPTPVVAPVRVERHDVVDSIKEQKTGDRNQEDRDKGVLFVS